MNRKYFLVDKNYILKEVQENKQSTLLGQMITTVINTYLKDHNPLGLVDETVIKIKEYKINSVHTLDEFYGYLAGIFRYQMGTNQLEFLFDGRSHQEKYEEDWTHCFLQWVTIFCTSKRFLKSILALTVFYDDEYGALLAENRLKYFIGNYFNLKLYRYKGIISREVA